MTRSLSTNVEVVGCTLSLVALGLTITLLTAVTSVVATRAPVVVVIVFTLLCWLDHRGAALTRRADVEP